MTVQVAIFRQQLFKVSETFIVQQATGLTRYRPIYCGRVRSGPAPEGTMSVALQDVPGIGHALYRVAAPVIRATGGYRALLQRASAERPRLIHAHFGVDGVQALPLACSLRIPLVTTFHGFDATTRTGRFLLSGSPSLLNYALHRRRLAHHGNLFLCASKFIRDRVLALGFPRERVQVHYIGVDVSAITARPSNEERPVILHVARLVEVKGTAYLIRAFARIANHHPKVRLQIIGDGPLREELARLAFSCGVRSQVIFMGAQPHLCTLAAMRAAQVLVLPSVTARSGAAEGLGMVLLEAAATGVAQIGTLHGGIPEAVEDGKTGYLVPERDIDALADRLERVLKDAELRRSMGAAARQMAEVRFNLKHQCAALEDIYDEVVLWHARR